MSLKDVQIFNHRHYRLIRNICIAVVFVALFIIPGVLQIRKLDMQSQQIKSLNEQVKVLTQRNVDLSQQNIVLNQQNIRHTDCVATVFAQFTHDNIPVSFKDLDSCSITTGTSGSALPRKVSTPVSPSKTSTSSSASASGQATSPASSSDSSSSDNSNTPPPKPQPNLLQRILNRVNIFN